MPGQAQSPFRCNALADRNQMSGPQNARPSDIQGPMRGTGRAVLPVGISRRASFESGNRVAVERQDSPSPLSCPTGRSGQLRGWGIVSALCVRPAWRCNRSRAGARSEVNCHSVPVDLTRSSRPSRYHIVPCCQCIGLTLVLTGANPKMPTSATKKGKEMELLILTLTLSTVAVIAQLADFNQRH